MPIQPKQKFIKPENKEDLPNIWTSFASLIADKNNSSGIKRPKSSIPIKDITMTDIIK
jgi:hypothetical protein